MVVGKIISIFDVSVTIILSSNDLVVGDILTTEDGKYSFEIVKIDSVQATCITLNSNNGLKKGAKLMIHMESLLMENHLRVLIKLLIINKQYL